MLCDSIYIFHRDFTKSRNVLPHEQTQPGKTRYPKISFSSYETYRGSDQSSLRALVVTRTYMYISMQIRMHIGTLPFSIPILLFFSIFFLFFFFVFSFFCSRLFPSQRSKDVRSSQGDVGIDSHMYFQKSICLAALSIFFRTYPTSCEPPLFYIVVRKREKLRAW